MRTMGRLGLLAATMCLCVFPPQVSQVGAQQAPGPEENNSVHKYDFRRIARLSRPDLSPRQRTALGLQYIREEIADPTPRYKSFGRIDHTYILAQLVLALGRNDVDLPALWQEFRRSAPGSEYRHAIGLTIGLAGDTGVSQYLQAYLRDTRHHYDLRERAVRALAKIGGPEVVPLFVDLLKSDPAYYVHEERRKANPALIRDYTIRSAARLALRRIKLRGQKLGAEAEQALKNARLVMPASPEEVQAFRTQQQSDVKAK